MKWRVLILCTILGVALAGPDGEAQGPASEPLHRGRTFGEWRQDLHGGTPIVRERAVVALSEFGEPAVPLLIGAIADHDFNVRTLSIFSLGRMGPMAKEAVPTLVKTLDDRDWIVRRYAAGALGLLGTAAVEAAPALARSAVEDPSSEVRQTSAIALGRLGDAARETAGPVLQQLSVAGADEAVRARAAQLLRGMEKR